MINPLNQPFNPKFSQAIQYLPQLEDGQETDTVVNVSQKGYSLILCREFKTNNRNRCSINT